METRKNTVCVENEITGQVMVWDNKGNLPKDYQKKSIDDLDRLNRVYNKAGASKLPVYLQTYSQTLKEYDKRGIDLDAEFMDNEDSIQERMLSLLELQAGLTAKTYVKQGKEIEKTSIDTYIEHPEHLRRSLKWYARKRQLDFSKRQARYSLVSLLSLMHI